jgi:transketolase
MRTAFLEALCAVAERDQSVWLLTADLGYSVLEPFRDRFAGRYVNVGVTEQNLIGVAAGLARCGKIVFVYSIANFPTLRCLEQIRNDVCYHEGNVKIVAVGGGFTYGPQGYTHHGIEDLAILRALPGMTVVAPADPVEARLATRALAARPGPCYLRLGKANEPVAHAAEPDFALGRAVSVRAGRDVTLISTGGMLRECLAVAERLHGQGVESRVISMHTLKPLDSEAVLRAARDTGGIVTAEEHSVTGGLGSAVADVIAESGVRCGFFRKFGVPDERYHRVGSQEHMRGLCGDLYETVLSLLRRFRAAHAAQRSKRLSA